MNKKIINKSVFILLWTASICWAFEYSESSDTRQREEEKTNAVDAVLKQLNKKAIELNPNQAIFWKSLAVTLRDLGREDEAEAAYWRAKELEE